MKKKDIILIIGVVLVLLIAVFAMGGTKAIKVELPLVLSGDETGLIKIDYNTYESKIENQENFIVIIERTGCSYCEMYLPVVEGVATELSIPVYYIDTADLSQDEYNKLNNSNIYLKRNQWGTPTTLLMSGNIVGDYISGYVDENKFLEFINENIVLPEEDSVSKE